MEDLVRNIQLAERRHPHVLPLTELGRIQRKTNWVNWTFPTVNLSFILEGGGVYRFRNQTWDVEAPCVITQWPGERMEYGPMTPHSWWREVFFIYPSRCQRELARSGLARPEEPVWPIHNLSAVNRALGQLLELMNPRHTVPEVDRIDRLAELILFESRQPKEPAPDSELLEQVRNRIQAHPGENVDWDRWARDRGMSPATFRRRWRAVSSIPPGRFALNLRIEEACRLLIAGEQSIADIAYTVGFEDPLHFSRTFAKDIGQSPTEYRRRHRPVHLQKNSPCKK